MGEQKEYLYNGEWMSKKKITEQLTKPIRQLTDAEFYGYCYDPEEKAIININNDIKIVKVYYNKIDGKFVNLTDRRIRLD